MATAYMITNRNTEADGLGSDLSQLRYYRSESTGTDRYSLANWEKITQADFRKNLIQEMKDFPLVPEGENENQKHISLFIHGYNNNWTDALSRYSQIQDSLYTGPDGLGVLVLFSWPSNGKTSSYLSDRSDAADSRNDVAKVFVDLHDHVLSMQKIAIRTNDEEKLCRAKISVIAHSMGNYVIQKALATASKQLNNPQLITLIHQLAMVAADVDNDIFDKSKPVDDDGSLMANLCYRITALYTGLDQVLGASAGLKHFGTRRLGRSGLANPNNVYDNICQFDVSTQVKGAAHIHSGIFEKQEGIDFLSQVLKGVDRGVISEG